MKSFPFTLPAVRALQKPLDLDNRVTIFVGENGTGKSTLIEAIAMAAGFNPEGGSKNFNFATRRSESVLDVYIRTSRGSVRESDGFFLRAESFYNVSTAMESLDNLRYSERSFHEMSHGEAFLTLVRERFRGWGIYVMDEPEAALSPQGQINLMVEMMRLVRDASQLIIATHSPMLMAFPDAVIYEISESGIERVRFEETEHFKLFKTFLSNPDRFFRALLDG